MRIAIGCSGSGGHIFPALSLAERLKKERQDSEVIFFLPKNRLTSFIFENQVFEVEFSSIKRSIFYLMRNSFKSFHLLKSFKPQVVIGFGGYETFSLLLEAKILGTPVLIHEQNVIPGKCNRVLSYFVDRICISFPETRDYFPKINQRKVVFTGIPLREEIGGASKEESLEFFNLDSDKFTLLVTGGSQGSSRINSVFLETLKLMQKDNIQVIHITGFKDYKYVKDFYQKIEIKSSIFDFLDKMNYAYGAADLIVCRAGAVTLAEITFCGLASVLIPYPYAYDHQVVNALSLASKGAAVLIEDKRLSPSLLGEIITQLMNDKDKLKEMAFKSKELEVANATERLAKEIFSL